MQPTAALKDMSFQQLVAANRKAGRLAEKSADAQGTEGQGDAEKAKMVLAGMRLTAEEHAEAKAFARADSRSLHWFAHRMYHIGLAVFKEALAEAEAAEGKTRQ